MTINKNEKSAVERRKYKRVAVKIPVEYELFRALSQALIAKNKATRFTAVSENISAGGIQIITELDLQQEQIVKLKILHENSPKMCAHAIVRWSAYDKSAGRFRVGLEFFYLKDECREFINELTSQSIN
jgi:c-di-GMP-binding flagellar brake protein YcgR